MSLDLTSNWKLTRVSNAAAAATTDVTSSAVDISGYESVTFVVAFGAITASAVTSIKATGCATSGGSYSDLAGTGITVADDDDNQIVALEVVKPRLRYVKCVVDRGTANAVVDGIFALQGGPGTAPVTHDATTCIGSELHHSPATGTA